MKGLRKPVSGKLTDSTSWINENRMSLAHREENKATTKIILKLIDYADKMGMNQSELARRLGVTPQYIHKLFHGQDNSFRIETALEYGEKLGIRFFEILDDDIVFHKCSLNKYEHISLASDVQLNECDIPTEVTHSVKREKIWMNQLSLSFA